MPLLSSLLQVAAAVRALGAVLTELSAKPHNSRTGDERAAVGEAASAVIQALSASGLTAEIKAVR